MIAILRALMTMSLASRILTVLGVVVAAAIGGAATISWVYWSPRVALVAAARDKAQGEAKQQADSAKQCAADIGTQNAAVFDLKARLLAAQADAAAARDAANKLSSAAQTEAQSILAETDSPKATECEADKAAGAAFDAELIRERHK